jgi:23S rRNA (cytosine1962-C5)-methyltransferase
MNLSDKLEMFRNRLIKVYRHRGKQAKRMSVRCYRLYDKDLPEFPVSIDVYDDKICLSEYRAKHTLSTEEYLDWLEGTVKVVAEVTGVLEENVFTKERRRKSDRYSQYQKTGEEKEFFEVEEGGLKFLVNLSDYLDTGLFLDHRITRQMVRDLSLNKRVLNLFAYTGSFSVYAAAGGATNVTTVDLSNTYLQWAKNNFAINHFQQIGVYEFISADVKQYLQKIPADSYDIIVMDPPTFSNSKKMNDILDIQRDHVDLLNQALQALAHGGILFFSTNARKFELYSGQIHATQIKDITKATTPFDFEGKLQRWCWRMDK